MRPRASFASTPPGSRAASAILAALLVAGVLLTAPGCEVKNAPQRVLIEDAGRWFTGITERRFDLLAQYDANAPKPGTPEYERWKAEVEGVLDRYEAQKQQGHWEPDPTGYALVRALNIGTNPGTLWGSPGREGTLDEPILIVKGSFAYDEIVEQRFPEGTKVYLQGYPVGRVHRVEIGGEAREIDILDALQIRVHMRRNPNFEEGAPEGAFNPRFRVVRAELIDGSAEHRVVKWVY